VKSVAFDVYSQRLHCKGILVIPIWYSIALGSVLAISTADTPAQYNPHLGLNKQDQDALAGHRLTVQNVRQMFAVDRELLQLLKKVPGLDARAAELERRFDSQRLGIVAVGTTVYEAMPETAQILQKHRISGRDYLLTKIAAMIAEISDGASSGRSSPEGAYERRPFQSRAEVLDGDGRRPQGRSG